MEEHDPYTQALADIADLKPGLLVRFLEESAARLVAVDPDPDTANAYEPARCLSEAVARGEPVVCQDPLGGPDLIADVVGYTQKSATNLAYKIAYTVGHGGSQAAKDRWQKAYQRECDWHNTRVFELLAEAERILTLESIRPRPRLSSLAKRD